MIELPSLKTPIYFSLAQVGVMLLNVAILIDFATPVSIVGIVVPLFCIFLNYQTYQRRLAQRKEYRQINFKTWLDQPVPELEPQTDWEEFEKTLILDAPNPNYEQKETAQRAIRKKIAATCAHFFKYGNPYCLKCEGYYPELTPGVACKQCGQKGIPLSRIGRKCDKCRRINEENQKCRGCGIQVKSARGGVCERCQRKEQELERAKLKRQEEAMEALKMRKATERFYDTGTCDHKFLKQTKADPRVLFCETCGLHGEIRKEMGITSFVPHSGRRIDGTYEARPVERILRYEPNFSRWERL